MLIDEAWAQLAQEHGVLTDASPDRSADLVLRVPSWSGPLRREGLHFSTDPERVERAV